MAAPTMNLDLYPLRFEPIYQYRLWGGRRLAEVLGEPLRGDGPIGEAWVLSDRADHPSRVADGPLAGRTIAQLLEDYPDQLLGEQIPGYRRFPLLLKFLDARDVLSVQVHPSDRQQNYLPDGEPGRPRRGWSWRPDRKAASTPACNQAPRQSVSAGLLRTPRCPTASPPSRPSPGTPCSCRRGPFTRWAVMWSCSRFNRTAMSPSASTTGTTSTRAPANPGNSTSTRRWLASTSTRLGWVR